MTDVAPLLTIQFFATSYMTGVIWFVQLVHYPLFAEVSQTGFPQYARRHRRRTGYVVGPAMVIELVAAVGWILSEHGRSHLAVSGLGLILVLGIWLVTATVFVPLHTKLATEFNPKVIDALVRTNWIRTTMWSLRSALLLGVLMTLR